LSIRLLLLQAFGALASLEQRVVSELLNSVLPLELARDIHNDLSGNSLFKLEGARKSAYLCQVK